MDYKKIYNELMSSRKDRELKDDEQYEKHHIIPKCMGGSDKKDNIVRLTYREHFLAHMLLVKITTGKDRMRMGYALHRMHWPNNSNQQYRIDSGREYEKVKMMVREAISGKNASFYGRKHTDEAKKKVSEARKGSGNGMYGKPAWNSGKTKEDSIMLRKNGKKHSEGFNSGRIDKSKIGKCITEEGRKRLSDFQKGRPVSEETRKRISDSLVGRKIDPEIVAKTADKLRGKKQKILTCPHCGKQGGTTMHRWHFDRCKNKKEVNDG
jgi:hypothetical protein